MIQLNDLPENDALRSERFGVLFGELNRLISIIAIKDFRSITEQTLKIASVGFWIRECSLKYHPKEERGIHGNLIHTINVAKLVLVIANCCMYNRWHTSRVLSAAILHDICRHGLDGLSEYSEERHPELVRLLMDNHRIGINSPAREEMLNDIERHMGRWYDPSYAPGIVPSEILHLADAIDAKEEEWSFLIR